jgi:hypothetical protein
MALIALLVLLKMARGANRPFWSSRGGLKAVIADMLTLLKR